MTKVCPFARSKDIVSTEQTVQQLIVNGVFGIKTSTVKRLIK